MPVSLTERATTDEALTSESLPSSHPFSARPDLHVHLALLGELEGVGEEVLEDLAEALRIGDDACGAAGLDTDRVADALCFGDVLEVAQERVAQLGDRDILHLGGDGPGLDLGQLEDAVQKLEQIAARGCG
jgi:hypothetical protein